MKLLRQSGLHQRQHQRQHRQHQHGVYSLLARSIVIGFIVPLKVAVGDSTAVHGAALEVHGETAQVKQVVGNELYLRAREDVLDALSDGNEKCDNWRKSAQQQCTDAQDCGKGWLFRRKGLIFVMPGLQDAGQFARWTANESRIVTVLGLKEQGENGRGEEADCDASNLSMLLRLQGPEALAEAAIPIEGRCAWSVKFQPSLPGVYTLDVTLMEWKGFLEPHRAMCNMVEGVYGEGSVKSAVVPSGGGPFYGAQEGCCSLCTRSDDCVAWSATDQPSIALVDGNRCVLYSSVVGEPMATPEQHASVKSGTRRHEEAMTYLGPSMDMRRSWCAEWNGQVFGSGSKFTIRPTHGQGPSDQTVQNREEPPFCRETLLHEGRWVRLDGVDCDSADWKTTTDGWRAYSTFRSGPQVAEECFLQPPKTKGPGTAHETDPAAPLDIDDGYVFSPYECRYDLMNIDDRIQCFRDKNVTRFLDFGDSLISTSRMPRTALFLPQNPEEWSSGKGRRQIAEGANKQGCTGNQAVYYGHDWKSGTHYCGAESRWQSPVGGLKDIALSFSPDVILANWALVHRLWHESLEDLRTFVSDLGNSLDEMDDSPPTQAAGPPRYKFWLPLPFLVSEREPHCVQGRAERYNAALRELLAPRGWIEVPWQAMTKKWALDIADGMHHGPPPTRMLAYLLMHHICHG